MVLPSTDGGDLLSRAFELPPPPPDPAAGHLGRLRIPPRQTCSAVGQGHLARLEHHAGAQMVTRIVTASSKHRYQRPGGDVKDGHVAVALRAVAPKTAGVGFSAR